jgi:hypothetical protein
MYRYLIFTILFSSISICQEVEKKTKEENIIMFSINHTVQIPGGDLAKRFGINSDISGTIMCKTKNNLLLSLETGFLFGGHVKENNLFNAIDGDDGSLISQNGEIPIIRLFQRGGHLDVNIGKYLKIPMKKSDSGILISIGMGYLYHKIFIETLTIELPQLNEELIKGYDRLCAGVTTKQFIGYMYFSKKNNIRFLIGLESIQAFTKSLRGYNYNTQSIDNAQRKDYLFGFKTGFIIPINQRKVERYYIY